MENSAVDAGTQLTRRVFLLGAVGAVASSMIACTGSSGVAVVSRSRSRGPTTSNSTPPQALDCPALDAPTEGRLPLWEQAIGRGLVFGSSTATWQISDAAYRRLYTRESAILFTEDDLLWYRLKPTPTSDLDFSYGDEIIEFAERNGSLVLGAHLVWDEGFGEGWTDDDLWGMDGTVARDLIMDTIDRVVGRYRGRVAAWIVANEVLDGLGQRTDVPWYQTIGPSYVAESFVAAHEADPDALLMLNDYGYETDEDPSSAADRRAVALQFLDELLADGVPVHALGVQAHLQAADFRERFDADAYRAFLSDVADRGLAIMITEMDVLDDGLPASIEARDQGVADALKAYLEVALEEPAVISLATFGLSDRYTWLEEDYPRGDGAPRRPLAFDDQLRPKPAFEALQAGLKQAATRRPFWTPPRCA